MVKCRLQDDSILTLRNLTPSARVSRVGVFYPLDIYDMFHLPSVVFLMFWLLARDPVWLSPFDVLIRT